MAVLLTADPKARQRYLSGDEMQIAYDKAALTKRIGNLIRVWNIQIIEVLGPPGSRHQENRRGRESPADLRRSGRTGLRHLQEPGPNRA